MLTLKTTFENDTRRRQWAQSATLAELRAAIGEMYGAAATRATLKYVDDDGDLITLGSELELREALALATAKNGGVVRVSVFPTAVSSAPADKNDDDDDDDEESSESEEERDESPLAAIRAFFGALGGEEAESERVKVREFFEQLGAQLASRGEQLQAAAGEHVERVRGAVASLLERGVVTPAAVRDVSEALLASPRAVQELVLALVTLVKQHAGVAAAAAAAAADGGEATSNVRHSATCDACRKLIVGVRFKCANCADYDLCATCEAANGNGRVHDRTHVFLKLTMPLPHGAGFLMPNLYGGARRPCPTWMGAARRGGGGACRWGQANNSEGDAQQASQQLEARFVRDVTVRDGSVLAPTSKFVKIWTLRSSGRAAWPAGCRLVFVGGDALGDEATSEPLPAVAVEQEVNVAVDMTAPALPGRYTSFWRLATPDAARFGHRLWCSVHVELDGPDCVADEPAEVVAAPVGEAAAAVAAPAVAAPAVAAAADDDAMMKQIERSFHKVEPVVEAKVEAKVEEAKVEAKKVEEAKVEEKKVEEKKVEEKKEDAKVEEKKVEEKKVEEAAVSPLLFASQLRQLSNMGFGDGERNKALLQRHSGDVLATVQELLAEQQ